MRVGAVLVTCMDVEAVGGAVWDEEGRGKGEEGGGRYLD